MPDKNLDSIIINEEILTPDGYVPLSKIKAKDKILCASGWGETNVTTVRKIKKEKYKGPILDIRVNDKKKIRILPGKLCFAKFDANSNAFYIVLIYRKDIGWRIGIERDMRGLNKQSVNYYDKYWVLDITFDEQEALYFQHLYSYRFGIPMVAFDAKEDKFGMPQEFIDRIFKIIKTSERYEELFDELMLFEKYPYYIAPNKQFGAKLLTIIMFGDNEKKEDDDWYSHRIFVNVDHNKISYGKTSIIDSSSKNAWSINTTRRDYNELIDFASVISKFEDLEIIKRAKITSEQPFYYFPASHIKQSMIMAVYNKKEKKINEQPVTKVYIKEYEGEVVSIEADNLRNCIVNDVILYG